MIRKLRSRSRIALSVCTVLTILAVAVYAGPPLLCWPFDIGGARSLPFAGDNWRSTDPSYNIQHLADDTMALLQPNTPVIVRMETLRRATVYTMQDREVAARLLERLEARSNDAEKRGKPDALALFDVGYLLETYKQAYGKDSAKDVANSRDGYALITRAIQLQGNDAEMEFAAAMVMAMANSQGSSSLRTAHLKLAVTGAVEDSLLAKNLIKHAQLLQIKGDSLGELRAQLQTK
jgi:hypothetical protein